MTDKEGSSIGPSFLYGFVWYAAYCVVDLAAVRLRQPGKDFAYLFSMSLPKWILIAPVAFIVSLLVGGLIGAILPRLESGAPARILIALFLGLLPGLAWVFVSHNVNVARMDWDPPHFDTLSRVVPALAASIVASIVVASAFAARSREADAVA
jgi:hypothetical protein